MSKFRCNCDYVISDVTCPSAHEARIVTDMEMDNFAPDGYANKTSDLLNSRELIECPNCWRVWIQQSKDGKYLAFLPEKEPLKLSEQQGGYRG